MRVHLVNSAKDILSDSVYKRVLKDVTDSIVGITANSPDKFIVNPMLWYNIVPTKKGALEAKPRVMNSADYLSKKLGSQLHAKGWKAGPDEAEIDEQKIDGYIEIPNADTMSKIEESAFIEFLFDAKKSGLLASMTPKQAFDFYYSRFCSNTWVTPKDVPQKLMKYFIVAPPRPIRVGLEFETGNIASSFRALMKLEHLFRKGLIDYGVFITSVDKKTTAAQIWPVSNRNGSFSELDNRRATIGLTVPLLQIGFSPDALSSSAGYLGSDGKTYKPKPTGKRKRVDGLVFQQFAYNGSQFWRPQE